MKTLTGLKLSEVVKLFEEGKAGVVMPAVVKPVVVKPVVSVIELPVGGNINV